MDPMKLTTTVTCQTNSVPLGTTTYSSDGILQTSPLSAVNIPQGFCFPNIQTSMATGFATNQQQLPGTPSPLTPSSLNMTLGFPMNMAQGAVGHPFVQPISMGQICTTVGSGLGIPLNQTIFAVSNPGQGQFMSSPFNQFQQIFVGGQQPLLSNAFMGAPQNGSMTNLAALGAPQNNFPLNTMAIEGLPKDGNSENVTESSNDSDGGLLSDGAKQELNDLSDMDTILNLTNISDSAEIGIASNESENDGLNKPEPESLTVDSFDDDNRPDVLEKSFVAEENIQGVLKTKVCSEDLISVKIDNSVTEPILDELVVEADSEVKKGNQKMEIEMSQVSPSSDSFGEASSTELLKIEEIKNEQLELDKTRFSQIDFADYNEDGIRVEYDQTEFNWENYLQETGAVAVPPTAFKHVECSLQSGFVKGMKLEAPVKSCPGTFWIASVVMTCGQLLRLRYDGYDNDSSADFWCDLMTSEIHPIGWCTENDSLLKPPEAVVQKLKCSDWKEYLKNSLTGAKTAPSYLLDKTTGSTPIDQLKPDMKLELQDSHNPTHIWIVNIIENVGGRLYLRFEGITSSSSDFWLFYLNHHLHPIGWCKQKGYKYKPPKEHFGHQSPAEIQQILDTSIKQAEEQTLPADIFKDQITIPKHTFHVGQKLEAVNPDSKNQICPATVIKVYDSFYFLVQIDNLQKVKSNQSKFCCHSRTPTIFPIHWCQRKGLRLTHPLGWPKPTLEFNWDEYLEYCKASPVPESAFVIETSHHEFEKGMKLEAVNPDYPNQLCAATITKIIDRLMWIHLDNSMKIVASHIETADSHTLFPVGWCESNGYQLKPPRKLGLTGPIRKRVAVVQPEGFEGDNWNDSDTYTQVKNSGSGGNNWCPKIFFNHKCFSGPYLSKGRIAELPKCVGPGPIKLVMKEVLTMLINVAYKSSRVLREIQMDGNPNPTMFQQILKAKYKNKCYRAVVEICKTTTQLEEFCRQICIKLECCPYLISEHFVNGNCPENCDQLTKTKYTCYLGKKKKGPGRPPGGHTNLTDGEKRPGKRKKKRKINIINKKSPTSPEGPDQPDEEPDLFPSGDARRVNGFSENGWQETANSLKTSLKRKYIHHVVPPSDIQTRGAKLPKYSFEKRTHKKIMHGSHHSTHNIHHGFHTRFSSAVKSKLHSKLHQDKHVSNFIPVHTPKPSYKKEDRLKLEKNPLKWSLSDVVDFIKSTDCAHLARIFKEQEIDGQALLLLTLPTVQEHLDLKLGPAIKLCHHIERVKIAFYETYAK